MTRELLGRVSKASQELFGQNASLRAPRVFETKTGELLRPDQELLGREESVPGSCERKFGQNNSGGYCP